MLDELPIEEHRAKPTKVQLALGFLFLASLAMVYFFFLYQALSTLIKY